MAKKDMIDDLVDIVYPWPDSLPDDADENAQNGLDAWRDEVATQRNKFEENLRLNVEHAEEYFDPLLAEIGAARREMREAEARMRLLVAYGREFVRPQPYQLKDLAAATGMSISGTRSAYDDDEIEDVSRRLGRPPRPRKAPPAVAVAAA